MGGSGTGRSRLDRVVQRWLQQEDGRVAALDCSLVVAALLATFTSEVVLWFHVVFVLLTLATLFLPLRPLMMRLVTWVPLDTLAVLYAVWSGTTARSELVEIPLLGSILVIVVLGAQRRERALNDMHAAKDRLEALAHDERIDLEARLERLQQLEALGRLSLGIAHDLNNVVTAFLGGSEELVERLYGREAQLTAREMLDASTRARELMDELVGYARDSNLQLGSSDVNEVATEMERMLRRLIRPDIQLVFDLRANDAVIAADRGRIGQILVNLVVNASDSIKGRGEIRVATHSANRVTAEDGRGSTEPLVVLSVQDTGRGIAPQVLEHIFEPGFTTKQGGRNLGMGMASVQRVVKAAGGFIDVRSAPGEGTTIRMEFPVAPRNAAVEAISEDHTPVRMSGEAIVVAEDDPSVRRRTSSMLRRAGYEVRATEDGAEALELILSSDAVGLLLTDVSMPGISGPELAHAVRRHRTDLPVLFMSGLTEDYGYDEFAPPVAALRKPFSSQELLVAVRALLDGVIAEAPTSA